MAVQLTSEHIYPYGRDDAMNDKLSPDEGQEEAAKAYAIGNSKIIIRSSQCVKENEDVEKILDEFSLIGWAILERNFKSRMTE